MPNWYRDPWRLECPEGHRSVKIRQDGQMRPDKFESGRYWKCQGCRKGDFETCRYDTVTDLKTGGQVRP